MAFFIVGLSFLEIALIIAPIGKNADASAFRKTVFPGALVVGLIMDNLVNPMLALTVVIV